MAAAGSAVLPVTQVSAAENDATQPAQPVEAPRKVDAAELTALLTDSANRIQPHLNSDQKQAMASLKKSLDLR